MINCPACLSGSITFYDRVRDLNQEPYDFSKCNNCQSVFINPMPSEKQLEQAYNESYYGEGESKFQGWIEQTISKFRQQEARGIARQIPNQADVLDIGCGNGDFLRQLSKFGRFSLYGVEPEGKSAERAAAYSEINLKVDYFKLDNFSEQKFDLLRFMHVFEHIPEPIKVLEYCFEICNPNALLIIEIPNIQSWQARWFKSDWFHYDPPRHFHLIPAEQLKKLIENAGFEVQSHKSYSFQFGPFGYQQSLLNFFVSRRDLLYERLKKNQNYYKDYNRFLLNLQVLFHWLSFPVFWFIELFASFWKRGSVIRLLCKKK